MWLNRLLLLIVICVALPSCDEEKGTNIHLGTRGKLKIEERRSLRFDGIVLNGPLNVRISKGGAPAVKLTGPENYLTKVTLKTETLEIGGSQREVLTIGFPHRIELPRVGVEVVVPNIFFVEANGASLVEVGNFSQESLVLRADGAGRIELAPSAFASLDIETGKAARVLASEVMAERARLRAYGTSLIKLGQVGEVDEEVISPAKIGYMGRGNGLK